MQCWLEALAWTQGSTAEEGKLAGSGGDEARRQADGFRPRMAGSINKELCFDSFMLLFF